MKQFASGAQSSEEAPRYDLIPLASLKRQAQRMAEGAASHGEQNYEKGATDATFVRDRVNHLLGHALAYAAGDRSEDHLGAVLANAGMLCRLEELAAGDKPPKLPTTRQSDGAALGNQPTHDERHLASRPCQRCGVDTYPATVCVGCRRKR
jgi:hypothetical protein